MEQYLNKYICHSIQRIRLQPTRIIFGISLCSATGYILYLMLKKRPSPGGNEYTDTYPNDGEYAKLIIDVKKESLPFLLGRTGLRIKHIERLTDTKISFQYEKHENICACNIHGLKGNCANAKRYIDNVLLQIPVLTQKDYDVPGFMPMRIQGIINDNIHYLQACTGAKCEMRYNSEGLRKINLTGTECQIEIASSMLKEIFDAERHQREELDIKLGLRMPRLSPRFRDSWRGNMRQYPEKLAYTNSDGMIEVYVSSVINPCLFSVQIVGPKANELDQLVEEMTEFYSAGYYCTRAEPIVGDMVAAPFELDGKWYRAEVIKLTEEHAEVYYVDYGDVAEVPHCKLFNLSDEFLGLRYQAIECYLFGIKPIDENWTDEAIDQFMAMTHVAQWKKLTARVTGYREQDEKSASYYRRTRDISSIPGISLYEVNNEKDVDIAAELVKNGYAEFKASPEFKGIYSRSSSSDRFETLTFDSGSMCSDTDTVVSS